MSLTRWPIIFKRAALAWVNDNIPTMGAALAYYTVFSLAPLLLIALAIIGLIYGAEGARANVTADLERLVGPSAAAAMESLLDNANRAANSGVTILAIVMLLFGASGVFVALQDAINRIWKEEARGYGGIWHFVRVRLLAAAAVIGTGAVLLASLLLNAVLSGLSRLLPAESLPAGVWIWQVINFAVSTGFVSLVFAAVYKFLPEAQVRWKDVWAGALVAGLLFAVGKHLFGLYLSRAGVTTVFGAAGSLVIVLLWVYYSSVMFLFGAEVTHAYAHELGSLRGRESRRSSAFRTSS